MNYILKWVLFSNEKSLGILEIDDWKKEMWTKFNKHEQMTRHII